MNAEQITPTILVIDDNAANLGVLTGYLRGHGLQLMIARNGADGIEKARLGQPDLILLDVMMPDMDGFETCRRLKAEAETQAIQGDPIEHLIAQMRPDYAALAAALAALAAEFDYGTIVNAIQAMRSVTHA